MKILVLNSGSSSLKFQVIALPSETVLCTGLIEEIGKDSSQLVYQATGHEQIQENHAINTHKSGLERIAELLLSKDYGVFENTSDVSAIGHRVVHGGEVFRDTVLIDEEVKDKIKELSSLAPLHNPANLIGIEVAESIFKSIPQYAVFDTAFHATLPARAYRYPTPNAWYTDFGIRVYGFHGTSHAYIYHKAKDYLHLPEKHKVVTLHLGNGCSMAAIKDGHSIDTSMGLGPLSGLMMGTRSGDIDPSIIFYLQEQGISIGSIKKALNKNSGLMGMAGDNDLRVVEQLIDQNNEEAMIALDVYVYRIKKYIGAYAAALGGLDAIVFTGGVGENAILVRKKVCEGLGFLGISLDTEKNNIRAKEITELHTGKVPILVVPTNEELAIAKEVEKLRL